MVRKETALLLLLLLLLLVVVVVVVVVVLLKLLLPDLLQISSRIKYLIPDITESVKME